MTADARAVTDSEIDIVAGGGAIGEAAQVARKLSTPTVDPDCATGLAGIVLDDATHYPKSSCRNSIGVPCGVRSAARSQAAW